VLAYAVYRVPATYAAIAASLDEVKRRLPDLAPDSVLDVGAGPGTALWAVASTWPAVRQATALERDPRMVRLGRELASASTSWAVRHSTWEVADITSLSTFPAADIVVAGYVLGELAPDAVHDFLLRLWTSTRETAVLVEPGTPRGFAAITRASDALAGMGAHIVAPVPHGWRCVESGEDWCHFSVRVPRTRSHRLAKEGALSYEDEKYAYVVASRHAGRPLAARVIRHPQQRSGLVRLVVCTASGVRHLVVTRKQGEVYRRAKDLRWGSAIEPEHAALFGLE
jgi:ribosomal protein RSM22 (predicted rRNA methylase)